MADAARVFGDHSDLARALLPHAVPADDGAHDLGHILRVWATVQTIAEHEAGADMHVLTAATVLHDCVQVEKDAPDREQASRYAAEKATGLLVDLGWSLPQVEPVCHAILAHSFSAQVPPQTVEARVLQDADRLDAIGMIGVARCFAVAGRLNRGLCDAEDPWAHARALDDTCFALDHFRIKLLRLSDGFTTETGQALARARHNRMLRFLEDLGDELGVPLPRDWK